MYFKIKIKVQLDCSGSSVQCELQASKLQCDHISEFSYYRSYFPAKANLKPSRYFVFIYNPTKFLYRRKYYAADSLAFESGNV